jgi:hypothetical protein
MVTVICPWCEEDQLLAFAGLQEPQPAFVCLDCGTTIAFVEDPSVALDLAA